jgi:hypothetical protein
VESGGTRITAILPRGPLLPDDDAGVRPGEPETAMADAGPGRGS